MPASRLTNIPAKHEDRDGIRLNHYRDLGFLIEHDLSENRSPLFRILLATESRRPQGRRLRPVTDVNLGSRDSAVSG
jgi:hypothetical protein